MAIELTAKNLMDSFVPISRFNRGEANRIFEEVTKSGIKIVLKNNAPACVLLTPERYTEIMTALEDYALFEEAERRVQGNSECRSFDDVLSANGLSEADLAGADDVEIE